jgi:hypothetical protein
MTHGRRFSRALSKIKGGGEGAIATHLQERFVANCSELRGRHCGPTGRANARPMTGSAKQSIRHTTCRHTREGGYPVRRGLSVQSLLPLGYWITRLRG